MPWIFYPMLEAEGTNRLHLKFYWSYWVETMVLDEVTQLQTDPMHNIRVLLDSQLLLREQVAVMLRRVFEQVHLKPQLCLFLDQHTLFTVALALDTSIFHYCNVLYIELPLKSIQYRIQWHNQLYELLRQYILELGSSSCIGCQFVFRIFGYLLLYSFIFVFAVFILSF